VGRVAIVGLERDAVGALDPRAAARLKAADTVVVPSASGVAASVLEELGVRPVSLGDLGFGAGAPADQVVEALVELAREGDVVFASAGYPFVREGVVAGLLSRAADGLDVFPVASPLQVLVLAIDVDDTADLRILDAGSLAAAELERDMHLIVTGIDNALIAHAVAGSLARMYAPEHTVVTAGCLEAGGFDLERRTLAELADISAVCRGSAVYIPPSSIAPPGGFAELVRIIAVLRGPDGCPWDREQTHESLAPHLIEEAYEAVGAIESGDRAALADELGDVLLQVVLHAEIGAGEGTFSIDDVVATIITKIRRRHPHIFGTVTAETAEEVTRNWDAIKRVEKPHAGALGEVPDGLPALMRAQKISRRAAGAGFEWEDLDGVWAKVHEEIDELKAAEPGTPHAEEELGDLLFTVVNVARKMGIDSESALRRMCDRFVRRFESMEQAAGASGRELGELSAKEWDILWEQAKKEQPPAANGGPDE